MEKIKKKEKEWKSEKRCKGRKKREKGVYIFIFKAGKQNKAKKKIHQK